MIARSRAAPHRRGLHAIELGAAIDLVRQDPRAVLDRRCARCASRSAAVSRAPVGLFGLQMTIILRARATPARSSASRSTRQRPAVAILDEPPLADRAAERARQAPRLHVVRHQHHDLVARLDQVERGDEVRFGAAVGDLDVIDAGARIQRRDRAGAARWCRWTASRPAAGRAGLRGPPGRRPARARVSGRTPLSDRLNSTRFS